MPTAALEEYLETIYKLTGDQPVRPTQIADAMSVSGPTVTATLKRLESRGLVTREGTGVVLTPLGTEEALTIVRKHRVSERFLVDVLGLDWDVAHDEACRLEHALSPRVLEALERFLGGPTECPHGHPIPGTTGVSRAVSGRSLSEVGVGETVEVLRVAEDADSLRYLGDVGLRPGITARVVASEPFDGPVSVDVGGRVRALSREMARSVIVR